MLALVERLCGSQSLWAAKVIAAGWRTEIMDELVTLDARVRSFQLRPDGTLDWQALISSHGKFDVFVDFTPPAAAGQELTKSGMMRVKAGGRVVLVGGVPGDVPLSVEALWKCLSIKGSMMCPRGYVTELVKLIDTGMLRLGAKPGMRRSYGHFVLHERKEAPRDSKGRKWSRKRDLLRAKDYNIEFGSRKVICSGDGSERKMRADKMYVWRD